jgi:integrase
MKNRKHKSKNTKWPTGLFLYCGACKRDFRDGGICPHTKKSIKSCPEKEKQDYRSIVYVDGTKERNTKVHKGMGKEQASVENAMFRAEKKGVKIITTSPIPLEHANKPVEGQNQIAVQPFPQPKENKVQQEYVKPERPIYNLLTAITHYVSALKGERGYDQERKKRGASHTADVERSLTLLSSSLTAKGIDVETLDVRDFTREHVSFYHTYLLNICGVKNVTYNRRIANARTFFKYLKEGEQIEIGNPFASVKKRAVKKDPKSIKPDHYSLLMSAISEENGIEVFSTGGKRQHFFPEIKFVINFFLMSGLRREQAVLVKYSDIIESQNVLRSSNLKANRIIGEEDLKITYVPITARFWKILKDNGYEKYKGTDKYVICPESEMSRVHLMNKISKTVSHYMDRAGLPEGLSLRHFRKSFSTEVSLVAGSQTHKITDHGSERIVDDHYKDKARIAEKMSKKKLFADFVELSENTEKPKTTRREIHRRKSEDKQIEK